MTFFERFVRVYRTIKRFIVITSVEFLLRIPTTPAESGALSHVYLREATCFILAIIAIASIYYSWFQDQLVQLKLPSCRSM